MKIIDLRSDTVTKPSPEMRRAMAEAEVGDDVFGDDPTVNKLQQHVAELLGKEAALFCSSGSMANTLAILAHTQRGDEVIVEKESHTFNYEVAAAAALAGVQLHPLAGELGVLEVSLIERAIRPENIHNPPTRLICLENTHNRGGGKIYPLDRILATSQLARKHNLKMHLDGARLFNACIATGIKPNEYAHYFDSVAFCFSKGLGAPVGSILTGKKDFINIARRYRKMLGGGMRQVGILAAAALYALEYNVERLAEDHENARLLASGISEIQGFTIDLKSVETNIIIFDVSQSNYSVTSILSTLKQHGILMISFGKTLIRAVTHLDVSKADIVQTLELMKKLFTN
jgi:threonine aldolase